jgi:dual specificity protein kinase YAK1
MNLEAIVTNYPYKKNLPEEDIKKGYSYIPRI